MKAKHHKKPRKSRTERAWAKMRATFAEPVDFEHKFPGAQPRQILIAALMGRV